MNDLLNISDTTVLHAKGLPFQTRIHKLTDTFGLDISIYTPSLAPLRFSLLRSPS